MGVSALVDAPIYFFRKEGFMHISVFITFVIILLLLIYWCSKSVIEDLIPEKTTLKDNKYLDKNVPLFSGVNLVTLNEKKKINRRKQYLKNIYKEEVKEIDKIKYWYDI